MNMSNIFKVIQILMGKVGMCFQGTVINVLEEPKEQGPNCRFRCLEI